MKLQQKLDIQQVEKKLLNFRSLDKIFVPQRGWIHTIRTALKMSLRQLGDRLEMTAQGAKEIEEREENGSISLNSLRAVGKAMNMKLVYGFIPENGSLEQMIEERAKQLAREIVLRTSQTMKLEAQDIEPSRIVEAIEEKTKEIKAKMPRYLWD